MAKRTKKSKSNELPVSFSNSYNSSPVASGATGSEYGQVLASDSSRSIESERPRYYSADEFTNPRKTGPDFSFVNDTDRTASANSVVSNDVPSGKGTTLSAPKAASTAAKREAAKTGVSFSNSFDSTSDLTVSGPSESEYGQGKIGKSGTLKTERAGGVASGNQPYYEAGEMDRVGGPPKSPTITGAGGDYSNYDKEVTPLSDEKLAQRAEARRPRPPQQVLTPTQQVASGVGGELQQAGGKGKVGLAGMLSSGKVGRNALAGAAVGAVLGGLNPAGDDGLFGGAMGGGIVGAAMGGLAGAVNANMNPKGSETISKGGRLFPGPMKDGVAPKGGKAGMLMSVGGVVGGLMGGLIGGSGKGKRHNTIDSNGWSRGTHPAYF
jgi:hypothetical protein